MRPRAVPVGYPDTRLHDRVEHSMGNSRRSEMIDSSTCEIIAPSRPTIRPWRIGNRWRPCRSCSIPGTTRTNRTIRPPKLMELRDAGEQWMDRVGDMGFVAEDELIERFWPGREHPVTAQPVVTRDGREVTASSTTAGTRYRLADLLGSPASGAVRAGRVCRPSSRLCAQRHGRVHPSS